MREEELLESEKLRNEMAGRVEILDKVKTLLLIPNTDTSTIKQVAEYYEVVEDSIKTVISRHGDELNLDGLKRMGSNETKDYLGSFNMKPTNYRGYFEVEGIKFSNKTNLFIPRRAILRIGMLLRDSEVAKEVRSQLLNIEEKITEETKTQDINEEQKLMLEYGIAFASGNVNALSVAGANIIAFKNRHITEQQKKIDTLEDDNEKLAKGILTWEDRSKISFAIRRFAKMTSGQYGIVWNELYKQLKYKYHIDVKARGEKPYIENIKENEWEYVMKTFSAMCVDAKVSPTDILESLEEVK
jgi:hypothetical protein